MGKALRRHSALHFKISVSSHNEDCRYFESRQIQLSELRFACSSPPKDLDLSILIRELRVENYFHFVTWVYGVSIRIYETRRR